MRFSLISVGDEVLCGDVVNTNVSFLAQELTTAGFDVLQHLVVSDTREKLKKTFDYAFQFSNVVITSGGLGPTQDDLTKETATEYFGQSLEMNEEALSTLKNFFAKKKEKMAEANFKQAMFSPESILLVNDFGTAPGAILSQRCDEEGLESERFIILLPGPPRELKPMFRRSVLPWLNERSHQVIVSRRYQSVGLGESDGEDLLKPILSDGNPSLAPYAKLGYVEYKMVARAESQREAEELIKPLEREFLTTMKEYIVGDGSLSLEETVVQLLQSRGLTLAAAESCTGGLFASTLVNCPGVSSTFLGSFVTYSNELKREVLGVSSEILERYGAVSEECVEEMARGAQRVAGSDIVVALTGLAGPEGGTKEKPIGLVYLGILFRGEYSCERVQFLGDRNAIRHRVVILTLYRLWQKFRE